MSSIILPARCDRTTVVALLPELIALQGQANGPISIDATQMAHGGQPLLQLLISARRSGEGAIILPSPALRELAELAGVVEDLFQDNAA